jgi:hypothetical protein
MTFLVQRRHFLFVAAVVAGLVAGALVVRYWLGGYVVRSVLTLAGASGIEYAAVRATPWRIETDRLKFAIGPQEFSARRVTVVRTHWWLASLGEVRVEGAEIPVVLDKSDVDPWNWSTYDNGLKDEPVSLPFQTLDFEGQLIVRMGGLPDLPIALQVEGRPKGGASWIGSLLAKAPGLSLAGSGSLLRAGQELDFQVHHAELDLETWGEHLQRLILLPGAPWTMSGKLTGVAEGHVTAKRFASTARVSLRDGRMKAGHEDITATGAEAELEFSDLWKYRTKSAAFRLAELRTGRLTVREVSADFGLWGKELRVERVAFQALGGRAVVDPFRYDLSQREVALTLHAEDLDLTQLLALTADVPARVPGRVGGTLPLRIHSTGVRMDPGFLSWRPEGSAEMQLNPSAILRSGAQLDADSMRVLRAAGADKVRLQLEQLELAIRPPEIPLGSSARVRLAGQTPDGPLAFDLFVNGALERYLKIMRSR